jgi:hypothetical protein
MGRRRAAVVTGVLLAGAFMSVAALAWACTNFLRIDALTPTSVVPATKVAVHGLQAPAGAAVDVRWNAVKGSVLSRVQADANGVFSADVEVPNVPDGIYVIVATVDGNVARAAVEVGSGAGIGQRSDEATAVDVRQPPSSQQLFAVGIGALAVGLVAMMTGVFIVSARRRRALAVPAGPSTPSRKDLVEVGRR